MLHIFKLRLKENLLEVSPIEPGLIAAVTNIFRPSSNIFKFGKFELEIVNLIYVELNPTQIDLHLNLNIFILHFILSIKSS